MDSYSQCIDSPEMDARLQADRADAQQLHITGVPTFFIGTERAVGSKSTNWLEEKIGDVLAEMKAAKKK